jgi:hypothetical protein
MTNQRGMLAIVAYRCVISGSPDGSIDIQVRWFDAGSPDEIRATLMSEPFHEYANPAGEPVVWEFVDVLAVEPFEPKESGEEVIGFITEADDLNMKSDA